MFVENLCGPAVLYLGFALTQVIIDLFRKAYNTAIIKSAVAVVFTTVLNMLCRSGLTVVSWFIVFIPFVTMTLVTAVLLYVFGLAPFTGDLTIMDKTKGQQLPQNPAVSRKRQSALGGASVLGDDIESDINGFYNAYQHDKLEADIEKRVQALLKAEREEAKKFEDAHAAAHSQPQNGLSKEAEHSADQGQDHTQQSGKKDDVKEDDSHIKSASNTTHSSAQKGKSDDVKRSAPAQTNALTSTNTAVINYDGSPLGRVGHGMESVLGGLGRGAGSVIGGLGHGIEEIGQGLADAF
jgi:hypothetical protein